MRSMFGLSAAVVLVASTMGMTAAHAAGFGTETVWNSNTDDWESTVAADPSSSYVFEMTTRYGGNKVCAGLVKKHCVVFRSSSNGGSTWGSDQVICWSCKAVQGENDPEMRVASDGTIYALLMNDWDVMFAKSADHGATWTAIHDFRTSSGLSFTDKPMLAISANGQNVYVAYNASDSYIVASHDAGATWGTPIKTNADGLYWFAEGSSVAPDGTVFFAESAENQNSTGPVQLVLIRSTDGGATWTTNFFATSEQQPACTTRGCPADFFGSQANVAVDSAGSVVVEWAQNATAGAPLTMYVARSTDDGSTFGAPVAVSTGGAQVGANFPQIVAGPTRGDLRIAYIDDRNGAGEFNVWYQRSTDSGATWTPALRLSNATTGAAYKNADGFAFPYGDYLGLASNGAGTNYVIWSEGTSYAGPGGAWMTSGS